jgi:hypothetical protein
MYPFARQSCIEAFGDLCPRAVVYIYFSNAYGPLIVGMEYPAQHMRNILRHLKDMATAAQKLVIYLSYLFVLSNCP